MDTIISIIASIFASIVSSVILLCVKMYLAKIQAENQKREKLKNEESVLILRFLNAVGKLTHANSIALRDGKTNGELASAMKEYEQVDREIYEYLLQSHTDNY